MSKITIVQTATAGAPQRLSLRTWLWNGTALSRDSAHRIRDDAVTSALSQKNCAATTTNSRNSAHALPSDFCQMYCTSNAPALSVPATLGIANVTASSRIQPNTPDHATEVQTPRAALREALCVSSLTCTEAS